MWKNFANKVRTAFGASSPAAQANSNLAGSKPRRVAPPEVVRMSAAQRAELAASIKTKVERLTDPTPTPDVARQMVFDGVYRCCNTGKCYDGGVPCVFPQCIAMRPVTKGAELRAQRASLEESPALDNEEISEELRTARSLALEEKLEEAMAVLEKIPDGDKMKNVSVVWRGLMLANLTRDAEAVDLLLSYMLKARPDNNIVSAFLDSAVCWAVNHDMMVAEKENPTDDDKQLLMPRVAALLTTSEEYETTACMMCAQEIGAVMSRMELTEHYRDMVEPPMDLLMLSVKRYRRLPPQIFTAFVNRLLIPPMPKSPETQVERVADAVGRSMILNEIARIMPNDMRLRSRLKELLRVVSESDDAAAMAAGAKPHIDRDEFASAAASMEKAHEESKSDEEKKKP
eukprot:PhM_4_TR12842/c0_g1_i1/m.28724